MSDPRNWTWFGRGQPSWPAFALDLPPQMQPPADALQDDDLVLVSVEDAAPVEMSFSRLAALLKNGSAAGSVRVGVSDGQVATTSFATLRRYLFGPEHPSQPAPEG